MNTSNITQAVSTPGRATFRATRLLIGAGIAVTTAGLVAAAGAASSSGSTTAPQSTPQQRIDALTQPSIAFLSMKASGAVAVPWSDNTTHVIKIAPTVAGYCSASFVTGTGTMLSAGHCVDPDEFRTDLIADAFYELQEQGLANGLQLKDVQDPDYTYHWTVLDAPKVTVTAYPMSDKGNVATDSALSVRVLNFEPLGHGDTSVLQANIPSGTTYPALAVADAVPAPGIDVVSIGFPGSITKNTDVGTLAPTFNPGQTANLQTDSTSGAGLIGVTATIAQGMSGGPTVDNSGRIVGVNSQNRFDNEYDQKLGAVVSTDELHRMLATSTAPSSLSRADQAWRRGMASYWAGAYREAVQQFDTVLMTSPSHASAQHYRQLAIQAYPLERAGYGRILWLVAAACGLALSAISLALLVSRQRLVGRSAVEQKVLELPTAKLPHSPTTPQQQSEEEALDPRPLVHAALLSPRSKGPAPRLGGRGRSS